MSKTAVVQVGRGSDACLDSIDSALRESLEVRTRAMSHLPPEYGRNSTELLRLAQEKKK